MSVNLDIPKRPSRHLLPEDFKVTTWDGLKAYYDELLNRPLTTKDDLERWLLHRSELESVISEDLGWRYIRMTCYTDNEEYSNAYKDFIQNIQPQIAPFSDLLNKKVASSPFLKELEGREGYSIMIRSLRKDIEIYRDENVPLYTEINTETQKYSQISGAMTVTIDGKELTLQQASVILMSTDRQKREDVYRKIVERRLRDKQVLDDLYSKLISLRDRVASNAGFSNFRDYMFKSYGRFDYTPADCFAFHESISSEVVPILNQL